MVRVSSNLIETSTAAQTTCTTQYITRTPRWFLLNSSNTRRFSTMNSNNIVYGSAYKRFVRRSWFVGGKRRSSRVKSMRVWEIRRRGGLMFTEPILVPCAFFLNFIHHTRWKIVNAIKTKRSINAKSLNQYHVKTIRSNLKTRYRVYTRSARCVSQMRPIYLHPTRSAVVRTKSEFTSLYISCKRQGPRIYVYTHTHIYMF